MNPFGLTPDDDPLDVAAVGADDQLVERLRRSLSPDAAVVWDDDDEDADPAVGLLRALQRDVAADLPEAEPVVPAGITALPVRRRLGRGAAVAAVAAGVLSIGGVAAASSSGGPLSGVRHAVSSAMTSVVAAITPDAPVGPKHSSEHHPVATASPSATSAFAAPSVPMTAQQLDALLTKAAGSLDHGQYAAAREQLDTVARKLPGVTDPALHDALAARLAALRLRLPADGSSGRHGGEDGHSPDATETHGSDSRGGGGERSSSPEPTQSRDTSRGGDTSGDRVSGDGHGGKGDSGIGAQPSPTPTTPESSGSHGDNLSRTDGSMDATSGPTADQTGKP